MDDRCDVSGPTMPRGSMRARAVRQMSRLTVKQLGARIPVTPRTIPAIRAGLSHALRAAAKPLRGSVIEVVQTDTIRGEWVRGPHVTRTDRAVLYVHGSGFVAGSARAYRGMVSRLSAATQLPVFTVDYRLAPESPCPAAIHDVSASYEWLRGRGLNANQIIVAGDSAGGFLAANLVIANAHKHLPPPAALILFSPLVDLSLSLAAECGGVRRDGLLSLALARRMVSCFTADSLELHPEPGTALPPMLVHTSDADLFADDAKTLAQRWIQTGADCSLKVWRDQLHVFQALRGLVPEANAAYRDFASFVISALGSPRDLERPSA